jgi:hypothetical protein
MAWPNPKDGFTGASQHGSRPDCASVLSEARTRERVRVTTMLCALSIKPLEGSRLRLQRTRSMGIQSIWSWKSLQRRELLEKFGN